MNIENALAVYKNKPAVVKERTADKILISVSGGDEIKVRGKDIEIIHPGPVKDVNKLDAADGANNAVRETWELLLAAGEPVPLEELSALIFGEYSPGSAWAAFRLLLDGLYFTGTAAAISARQREAVEADEKKRDEKQRESGERERFLERLRGHRLELPADSRFMQDVEALAFGSSPRSRTMKELGLPETPEDAHALLLETGFWTVEVNPHPARFGAALSSAKSPPDPPPDEERRDLSHLAAFAIDSPWSNDPDDAVSVEVEGGSQVLYVHVADPAASIAGGSQPEREARDRGATLYLPEGSVRMLADEALPMFALGLSETSPALTFKIFLGAGGKIEKVEIFPSTVKARRLTYHEADRLLNSADASRDAAALRELYALAERNFRRRAAAGAVTIDLPETHISAESGEVSIEPVVPYRSSVLVRECMLLAGEGAALWASGAGLPFPYISQETGDIPEDILPGIAGAYQLRRCMRPRALSVKPGCHWGLGLDIYTQVTSPLRRYTDLLAHIQIRALLRGGGTLAADELAARLAAAEAAAAAVTQAERASRAYWTAVYLAGKIDSQWDAAALEKKGGRWALMIPALALETQVPFRRELAPNKTVPVILKSVNIPRCEAVFVSGD